MTTFSYAAVILLLLLSAAAAFAAEPAAVGRAGFWRLDRDAGGTWWFVSPDGRREFLTFVTSLHPTFPACPEADGTPVPPFVSAHFRDGDRDRWATLVVEDVRQAGFKGIGAWSAPELRAAALPRTEVVMVWPWADETKRGSWFAPGWEAVVEQYVRAQVGDVPGLADDRNLVGYYLDNELDWSDAAAGAQTYFRFGPGTPQRNEVMNVIRAAWPDVAAFNAAWGTDAADLWEVAAWDELPTGSAAYDDLRRRWIRHLADDFFRRSVAALRRHDRNHLILGCRFSSASLKEPLIDEVIAASAAHVDATSLNIYPHPDYPEPGELRPLAAAGRPIVVSEFSYYSLADNRSGSRWSDGYPTPVATQADRAACYRQFVERMARRRDVVGVEWFQWADNPPTGPANKCGEGVNFGIVDLASRPYEPLVRAVRETADLLNDWHASAR